LDLTTLLKNDLGIKADASYRALIDTWVSWWRGFNEDFHRQNETGYDGKTRTRQIYSLRMGKKVPEDWASYLLNDKTVITIDDAAGSVYLLGDSTNAIGGVFKKLRFWKKANELIEKAFSSGTGAFVLSVDRLSVSPDGRFAAAAPESGMRISYLSAPCIYPISVSDGVITEAAFVSKSLLKGKEYALVEAHTMRNGQYVIENRYYAIKDGSYTETPLPDGIAAQVYTGSPYPWFVLVSPNIVNPHSGNYGMGCAIFSEAIDQLKGVDLAYNNFMRDFLLGGKKVFYNGTLVKTIGVDSKGKPIERAPDDVMQQLFVAVGDEFVDANKVVSEFNPSLRVKENMDGVQAQVNYLGFKCGMGSGHYVFDTRVSGGRVITATQYVGEKQELKQSAAKHGIEIERALTELTRVMLWIAKNILGEGVNPDATITIEFSDGYIVSDEEKRETDRKDVMQGIMAPWEYRIRWYGEEETVAKAALASSADVFGTRSYGE